MQISICVVCVLHGAYHLLRMLAAGHATRPLRTHWRDDVDALLQEGIGTTLGACQQQLQTTFLSSQCLQCLILTHICGLSKPQQQCHSTEGTKAKLK